MPASQNANPSQASAAYSPEQQADIVEWTYSPAQFFRVLNLYQHVDAAGARAYLDRKTKEAGDPSDPVERAMIEQIEFANRRLMDLHAKAAEAEGIERIEVYNRNASRLMGEFRRLALALQDYRAPARGRSTTIVHRVEQLNQAEGRQDVALAHSEDPAGGGGSPQTDRGAELTSNEEHRDENLHERRRRAVEESKAGCRRAAEPAPA